ncbi:hypothetical protein [Nostoc sp. UHCC 0251]|uniref:hypothetical protein n=1 Tax=Nostoc sp. UHCC 0251 TaxID=3110240 RepID=UPI002B208509|nr:hypothetical protein [Nostoc sp. UHCC 0251]MEA5623132.1 hypothetical protein [Nostoc sp. UHCC 0251]
MTNYYSQDSNDTLNGDADNPGFLTTPLQACACAGEQGRVQCALFFLLCPSAPLPHQTPEACEKYG